MRAVVYSGKGGVETIAVREMPDPVCGSDDALIEVAFAGLNRADILERLGVYGGARPHEVVPGLEFSGVVRQTGANVKKVRAGQRVCGLVAGGAHASLVAVQAQALALVPDDLTLEQAAAIPEAYLTAYDALFTLGDFSIGKSVLVHAIGSSVGLAALGLATRAGAFTIGTSRTPDKLERARKLGLQCALLLTEEWPAGVLEATGGRGVDVILDFVGEPVLTGNIAALAMRGRIVQIGTLGGTRASFTLGALMAKRGSLIGTMLRTRPLAEKIELANVLEQRLLPLFARGELQVEIDRVFPLADVVAAHEAMESNANFGKLVLAMA
jgi:putative PIG3 family NAD(P)H quinone oxidoreductase